MNESKKERIFVQHLLQHKMSWQCQYQVEESEETLSDVC